MLVSNGKIQVGSGGKVVSADNPCGCCGDNPCGICGVCRSTLPIPFRHGGALNVVTTIRQNSSGFIALQFNMGLTMPEGEWRQITDQVKEFTGDYSIAIPDEYGFFTSIESAIANGVPPLSSAITPRPPIPGEIELDRVYIPVRVYIRAVWLELPGTVFATYTIDVGTNFQYQLPPEMRYTIQISAIFERSGRCTIQPFQSVRDSRLTVSGAGGGTSTLIGVAGTGGYLGLRFPNPGVLAFPEQVLVSSTFAGRWQHTIGLSNTASQVGVERVFAPIGGEVSTPCPPEGSPSLIEQAGNCLLSPGFTGCFSATIVRRIVSFNRTERVFLPTPSNPNNYFILTIFEQATIIYRVRFSALGIQCSCVVSWEYERRRINNPSGNDSRVGVPFDDIITQSSETTPGFSPAPIVRVPFGSPVIVTHTPCSEWTRSTSGTQTYTLDPGTDARSTVTETGSYVDSFVGPVGPADSLAPLLINNGRCNPDFDDCTTQGGGIV